jgi:hypothetical protein
MRRRVETWKQEQIDDDHAKLILWSSELYTVATRLRGTVTRLEASEFVG